MSAKLTQHVWDHSAAEGGRLLVLLDLAWRANSEGACWPSVGTIADDCRLSPRQVKRHLAELAAIGEIDVPRGVRSEAFPFVVMPSERVADDPSDGPSGETIQGNGGAPTRTREEKAAVKKEVETKLKADAQDVWDYYLSVIPSRRRLGPKQLTQIKNALKVRSVSEIKRAIDGLAASPHHNGQNDRNTKYLELHYAIVPRNLESIEERIDKAASWGKANVNGAVMDDYTRNRLVEAIQLTQRFAHRPQQNRADDARAKLEAAGYTVTLLDEAPWVTVTL